MTAAADGDGLPPGYEIEGYRIDGILGQGGFGITYRAHDLNLDAPVALKEYLPAQFAQRADGMTVTARSQSDIDSYRWGLDRFLEEARTLARFNHPNIVRVLRLFEAKGTAYMAMPFEAGDTLSRFLKKRGHRPDQQELLALFLPLLDGIEAVHAAGFLHRDIKPSNILIRADDSPILLDFGSARQSIGDKTQALTSVVSPGYAPLEQYAGASRQGPWTDIYGLGAAMYWALVGSAPQSASERNMGHLEGAPDPVMEHLDQVVNVDGHVLAAIAHALTLSVSGRPQTVADWRAELLGEIPVPDAAMIQTKVAPQVGMDGATELMDGGSRRTASAAKGAAADGRQPKTARTNGPRKKKAGGRSALLVPVAAGLALLVAGAVAAVALNRRNQAPPPVATASLETPAPTTGRAEPDPLETAGGSTAEPVADVVEAEPERSAEEEPAVAAVEPIAEEPAEEPADAGNPIGELRSRLEQREAELARRQADHDRRIAAAQDQALEQQRERAGDQAEAATALEANTRRCEQAVAQVFDQLAFNRQQATGTNAGRSAGLSACEVVVRADSSSADAQFAYGIMLAATGEAEQAHRWLRAAADQNHRPARLALAQMQRGVQGQRRLPPNGSQGRVGQNLRERIQRYRQERRQ